jgi:HTH-type transcriptional regulator/antitoxin HigA
MILGSDPIYDSLVARFVPRPIRSEADYRAALDLIEHLLAADELHPSEAEYVEMVAALVHAYEERQHPIDDISGVDLLKQLMDDRGLRQRDLIEVFKTESIVSEVLAGKRELNKAHIEKLAAKFAVSPAAFFPARR